MHEPESLEWIVPLLHERRAVLGGHFVYASRLHGNTYLDFDILRRPEHEDAARRIAAAAGRVCLADEDLYQADFVIGPAQGGAAWAELLIAQLAHHVQKPLEHGATQKDAAGTHRLPEPLAARVSGKRVLIMEDVVTSGKSVRETAQAVLDAGGAIGGILTVVQRLPGRKTVTLAIPGGWVEIAILPLATIDLQAFRSLDCPLCRAGIPINADIGHGAGFLAEQNLSRRS